LPTNLALQSLKESESELIFRACSMLDEKQWACAIDISGKSKPEQVAWNIIKYEPRIMVLTM